MAYFRQSPWWNALRSGAWLTAARIRGYSLILLGISVIALVGWTLLSDGLIDRNGKPIGTDFSSFYAAGSLVLDGRAGDVYNMAAHYAREQQIFGQATPYYGWLYPPIFLLLAVPLASMPYPVALAVWQFGSFAFYLAVIGLIVGGIGKRRAAIGSTWLLVAAGFPAVLINLGHGQNGFLTAGLFGAALLALPSRQILAGVLFGLLAYKPQFALVIPIALLAAGQWRAIFAAGITVVALVAVTSLIFGFDLWLAFAASTETSRKLLLEQGDVGFEKLQSVFAAVRMWGGGIPFAYAIQGIVSIAVVCGTAWIWSSACNRDLKSALLAVATLLASPHVLDYDLVVLAVAIAFFVRHGIGHGFRDFEISVLAAAWIVPLLSRGIAGITGIPLGLLVLLALYVVTLRRAMSDREHVNVVGDRHGIAQA
ncbi:glycosyltransferase family 87 protein [Bradyrhizobium sp. dw_411]|uniref:glycosyltransferase family 87 protein n=1 Tax=Bradyrhizobium sp. dw_411 TaxID=2720082 RepID=UPI001BCF101B|nr:glycosyltransferase family 87 protein [Bradyrhizobium sp. dw_411]